MDFSNPINLRQSEHVTFRVVRQVAP